ncbi:MAG: alkaline phosphatase family protein [Planctomycetota bacterium]|jgi:hypothetical protein
MKACGLFVLIGVLTLPAIAGGENVILIGWDGAQRAHLQECFARDELPHLKNLGAEGSFVEIDIEGTTDTKAGWVQILTGYLPEVTGVYSNRRYQPVPRGLTIFERLEAHYGPERIVTLAVIGKKGNVDAAGPRKSRVKEGKDARKRAKKRKRKPEGKIVEEGGVKYRVVPGKPYFHTKDGMDLFENGLKLDHIVGDRALRLIEEHKDRRFFLFVHFAEVDHSGHKHGENSDEYNNALISNDYWTGRSLAKLRQLKLYDKTLVYVTADHGFDEGKKSHKNAPYVFLATNDKRVVRRGLRQDVAPTIYEALGLDPSKFDPPLDGTPLTRPVDPRKS